MTRLSLLIFAACVAFPKLATSAPIDEKTGKPCLCEKEEVDKVQDEFVACQTISQAKLRNGSMEVCNYINESIEVCGDLMAKCNTEEQLW